MTYDALKIIRSVFFRTFIIAFIVGYASLGVYYGFQNTWVHLVVDQWQLIDKHSLDIILVSWWSLMKFYLGFCLLIPALGIHWTIKSMEKNKC